MKDKFLIYCSLAVSIAAFSYSAWIHHHSEQMAQQALREREKHFVQTLLPRINETYRILNATNVATNATTLEELVGPYVEVFNRMGETPAEDEKKKP
ncbi:MAG: hypothetical protein ABSA47_02445 [Verrucomicrobiota bacterium]|jgi:hypothetical protein